MATFRRTQGYQGFSIADITIDDGESAVISFASETRAAVDWINGGVSWTIDPVLPSEEDFSVELEHSLLPEGDHWTPHEESPLTESTQGNETSRIERIRFTNTGDSVRIVVSSPSNFQVETP